MAGMLTVFAAFERGILQERTRAGLPHARETASGWVVLQLRPHTLRNSGNCAAPPSANPKSPDGCRSAAPRFAGFWADLFL
jgi:hypothetical protein